MAAKKNKNKKNVAKEETQLTDTFKRTKKSKNSKHVDEKKELNDAESTCENLAELSRSEIDNMNNLLIEFDLNCIYGPMIGISRTDRSRRAEYFNLPLNSKVQNFLDDENIMKKYPEFDLNIWHNYENIL